jgi:hypothetical protein
MLKVEEIKVKIWGLVDRKGKRRGACCEILFSVVW